ncbi:arginine deiminase [Bacillaceae bacterium SIJ1]|uniref:arginine deiminase n=1 Tax=Litoribacterium kuwaitense TaxID=1398745 RepID=UPI0013EDDEF0|nr:arginine deiminase [Litoribacterium kuwaitense]NGP45473.1 arginine deiminase [Litoribacterium kuwaitense]
MNTNIYIGSEIDPLQSVVIHRPGDELENLMPQYMERLLFDDIPYLPAIQREHDIFAAELQKTGAQVLYLKDLVVDVLQDDEKRQSFCTEFLQRYYSFEHDIYQEVLSYLKELTAEELFQTVTTGIKKKMIASKRPLHLADMIGQSYPFYVDPMTNLYFSRDAQSVIGDAVSINMMDQKARACEPFLMETVFQQHSKFVGQASHLWLNREHGYRIEGGDILVLRPDVLAIGISARTSPQAIESLARTLFTEKSAVTKVLAIELPKKRAFMHLDTVFTMVDHDKFTIHPAILGSQESVFLLEPAEDGEISITRQSHLQEALGRALDLAEVTFIPCGGGDPITAAREQWSDGANTFAVAPGKVMTYERNATTNRLLREYGLEVIEIPDSELSRGRGGPRCMTFPLYRKPL